MKRAVLTTLTAAFVLAPTIALAHTGQGDTGRLVHGFIHPLTGSDHVLVMVAVGLLSAQLGGRALWLVPLSFVSVMAIAGAFGMAGIRVPLPEAGRSVYHRPRVGARDTSEMPAFAAMAFVAFFAVFHGYVHGAEMPAETSGLRYVAGFVGATVLLQGVGIILGLLIGLERGTLGRRVVQAGGGAMALLGVAVLTRLL